MYRRAAVFVLLALFSITLSSCRTPRCCVNPRKLDAVTGATRTGKFAVLHLPKREAVKKVADFLSQAGPFFFATVELDQPRVRPIGIFMHHDEKIWFHVGKHKDSYRQLILNPRVELVSMGKNGEWIRITGRAVAKDDPVVDKATFEKAPDLKKFYNEESGLTLGHFYISCGTAEIAGSDGTVTRFEF